MQNFDCPDIIYGQVGKSIKHALQQKFTTCLILQVSRLNPYTAATISGQKIKRMGVQKYVGRIKESGRTIRRHSSFYIGLYGSNWVDFMENYYELVAELMTLAPNKRKYYQQGERAMRLILSAS